MVHFETWFEKNLVTNIEELLWRFSSIHGDIRSTEHLRHRVSRKIQIISMDNLIWTFLKLLVPHIEATQGGGGGAPKHQASGTRMLMEVYCHSWLYSKQWTSTTTWHKVVHLGRNMQILLVIPICREEKIYMILFQAGVIHLMPPLDVTIFTPMKNKMETDKEKRQNRQNCCRVLEQLVYML